MEAVMAPYNKMFKNMQNEVKQSKIASFFTKSSALFINFISLTTFNQEHCLNLRYLSTKLHTFAY